MSKLFIAAGTLVIALLLTALIGPYFVDWTAYRDSFEREASAYIGRPVNVAGKASVRLLPTPVLSFTNIRIGDIENPDMDVERFRAEVELAPLLKGEVRIIQMAVERPRFRIDLAGLAGDRGVFGGTWRIDPEQISLERVEVREGSASISDSRTGRTWQAEGINAVLDADSLLGPGRLDATLTLDRELFAVRAAIGRLGDRNAITANVSVSSPSYPVTLAADGMLHFPGGAQPSFDGVATIEGAEREGEDASLAWTDFRASGPFVATLDRIAVNEMQVSYGATERPLVLQASGQADLGAEPRFDLSLAARQVDLDRTLGGGTDAPVAIADTMSALLGRLPEVPMPAWPGALRLAAQSVVLGGGVVSEVAIDLATAGDAWLLRDFSALLPGETRIGLQGDVGIRDGLSFRGNGRVVSERPAALATWWRGKVGSAAQLGRFAVNADFDLQPESQTLANLVATTDAGTVTGAVELRRFQEPGQLFVTVDLSADHADIVEARALAELLAAPAAWSDEIGQLTLSLAADTLSAGGVDAHSVVVEGGYEAGRFDLRRLSVADLEGARIDAVGHVENPLGDRAGRIEASVEAEDISGAATFLARLAPESRLAARLVSAAPSLSPLRAEISAEADLAEEDLQLDLTGSFAETHLTVQAAGSGKLGDLKTFDGTIKAHADSADAATMLAQLGLEPLAVQSGPMNVDADFEGRVAESGSLELAGTIAGIDLTYAGETAFDDGKIALSGDFAAASSDIDTALLLAGVAVPGIGEGHAASASGRLELAGTSLSLALTEGSFAGQAVGGSIKAGWAESLGISGALDLGPVSLPFLTALAAGYVPGVDAGAWSDTAFAPALPHDLSIDLALKATELDLGAPVMATNAALELEFADGALNLDLVEADFAGGKLKGAVATTMLDGEVSASLSTNLTGGQLQALVWERTGLPVASGRLDVSVEAAGQGRSMAGIVATLSGNGSFAVNDGRFNALNPLALTEVMKAAEGEDEPDETLARETFASRFDSGAFAFGRAAGSFAIASGVMKVAKVSLESDATTVLADATLDLNNLTVDSDWTVRAEGEEAAQAQPNIAMNYSGPLADPERRVDLNPLLDLLRSRFLQRQLDQLEVLETERRRADAEAAAEEAARDAAAGEIAPSMESGSADAPPAEAGTLRQSDVLLSEDELEDARGAPPGDAPATPPPASASGSAEPAPALEAVAPELAPEPAPEAAPAPPAPAPPARRQAARPAPPPAQPPTVLLPPQPEFKTLPNGVVVKVR